MNESKVMIFIFISNSSVSINMFKLNALKIRKPGHINF